MNRFIISLLLLLATVTGLQAGNSADDPVLDSIFIELGPNELILFSVQKPKKFRNDVTSYDDELAKLFGYLEASFDPYLRGTGHRNIYYRMATEGVEAQLRIAPQAATFGAYALTPGQEPTDLRADTIFIRLPHNNHLILVAPHYTICQKWKVNPLIESIKENPNSEMNELVWMPFKDFYRYRNDSLLHIDSERKAYDRIYLSSRAGVGWELGRFSSQLGVNFGLELTRMGVPKHRINFAYTSHFMLGVSTDADVDSWRGNWKQYPGLLAQRITGFGSYSLAYMHNRSKTRSQPNWLGLEASFYPFGAWNLNNYGVGLHVVQSLGKRATLRAGVVLMSLPTANEFVPSNSTETFYPSEGLIAPSISITF